jgi:signal transduction histidine kinase
VDDPRSITLQRALLGALAIAMLAGFVPAGMILDRRLAGALEDRARADLAVAPRLLADRMASTSDAMMMHAKDLAHVPGLGEALAQGDRAAAVRAVDPARASLGGDPVVVGRDGDAWVGPTLDRRIVDETRAGRMPVVTQRAETPATSIHRVALAPVVLAGRWVGAAGVADVLDDRAAGELSGLARSSVIILTTAGDVVASSVDSTTARELARTVAATPLDTVARAISTARGAVLAVRASLPGEGVVVFTRYVEDELAVLPHLRRLAAYSAVGALGVALLLAALLAARVGQPVRELSDAASALGEGHFAAPLPTSRIREVARVAATFDVMRRALAARLDELRRANEALTDRNTRLTALQADLMQRDRLAATGRLVVQLAHEIRNPVAGLRNCLEIIRRRVTHDAEATEFADLAIDELLRMHELAEQMLDLNRPRDGQSGSCQPVLVAREVAALSKIAGNAVDVIVDSEHIVAAIAPDALKQVLLNLVQNAGEAVASGGSEAAAITIVIGRAGDRVSIEVQDNGPGIDDPILARIFDPFFTTKDAVHGVGLGLFVAEGLVRSAGGRLSATNRAGGGATFRIDLSLTRTEPTVTGERLVPREA